MEASASGCVISIPLELSGETFAFAALEDGTLIIEDQLGEEPLESVASIVERRVDAPYRARGFRIDASRWAVVAEPIDVIDLGSLAGETLSLVAIGDERRLVVDGALRAEALPPELEEEAAGSQPCILRASNVDEQWWELTVEDLPAQIAFDPAAPPAA